MRERFCKVCKGWHQLDAWPHNCMPERNWNRSELPGPMIISDTISDSLDGVQSMLDGKHYDSKSALRRTYKQAGVVEMGNDAPTTRHVPKTVDRKEVRNSVEKAFAQAGFGA